MNKLGKLGAICFVLWGLLHIVGSLAILLALSNGPNEGFAVYRLAGDNYDGLAGYILGYFAFLLLWIAILVTFVAIRFNWRNNEVALALNSAMVLLVEIGLIIFLWIPEHVGTAEALPGLVFFVAAAVLCGIACNTAAQNQTSN